MSMQTSNRLRVFKGTAKAEFGIDVVNGRAYLSYGGVEVLRWTASAVTMPLGMVFGDGAADTLGFYGATPTAQPAATAQSAVATTAITTLATDPTATDVAIAVNSLIARVAALVTLANATRSGLVTLGLLKGSN